MGERPLPIGTVDCPPVEHMPAWLRETAANTRAHYEDRNSGYVALRLDQAAEALEKLIQDVALQVERSSRRGQEITQLRAAMTEWSGYAWRAGDYMDSVQDYFDAVLKRIGDSV